MTYWRVQTPALSVHFWMPPFPLMSVESSAT